MRNFRPDQPKQVDMFEDFDEERQPTEALQSMPELVMLHVLVSSEQMADLERFREREGEAQQEGRGSRTTPDWVARSR